MKEKEFYEFIKAYIKDYLPEGYKDANVRLESVLKNNDVRQTGLIIQNKGDNIAPIIYLDSYFDTYQRSSGTLPVLNEIMMDISETYLASVKSRKFPATDEIKEMLLGDYQNIKNKLEIRICDKEKNSTKLQNAAHKIEGDFAVTFHVTVSSHGDEIGTVAVNKALMENWGVDIDQIYEDALQSDIEHKGVCLTDMESYMVSLLTDQPVDNMFWGVYENDIGNLRTPIFVLCGETNRENAASLIMHQDVMQRVGEILGEDFYVLPSSVHEVLIVRESAGFNLKELSEIVQTVNVAELSEKDFLSDHVQHYDVGHYVLENAFDREKNLLTEQKEKGIKNKPDRPNDIGPRI